MLPAERIVFLSTQDNALTCDSKKIIHIETLGCRLNQIESEGASRFFCDEGFTVSMQGVSAKSPVNNDVILCVVNTCTVTAKAEQKARRIIRLLLKKFPLAIVVVTGCYAQINKAEISQIDPRIVVLPGRLKSRLSEIPKIICSLLENSSDIARDIKEMIEQQVTAGPVPETSEDAFKFSTDTFLHHSRSSIKIQDGCNNRCTYCQICIARGKSVSLDAVEVIKRVNMLAAAGQKEVVITTVNIAQYKSEYNGKTIDFAGLLELLLEKTNGVSFRFSSLYPQIVDDRLCSLIKDDRIRPHFHLSVQSGSDDILLKMARPYKAQAVLDACRRLKEVKKDPFLACDIIAGFPTETDEDFSETMSLVKECGFAWVHAFPFSPRPNTKAFTMKPNVPEAVTQKRVTELLNYSYESKINYVKSQIGLVRKAIVETSHSDNAVHAVTDNFLHCKIQLKQKEAPSPSSEIQVRIIAVLEDSIRKNEEIEALAEIV